jgi:hypothetical protein
VARNAVRVEINGKHTLETTESSRNAGGGWFRSIAEPVKKPGASLPVLLNPDHQFQKGAIWKLLTHPGPSPLEHLSFLADYDPLLRVPFHEDFTSD